MCAFTDSVGNLEHERWLCRSDVGRAGHAGSVRRDSQDYRTPEGTDVRDLLEIVIVAPSAAIAQSPFDGLTVVITE